MNIEMIVLTLNVLAAAAALLFFVLAATRYTKAPKSTERAPSPLFIAGQALLGSAFVGAITSEQFRHPTDRLTAVATLAYYVVVIFLFLSVAFHYWMLYRRLVRSGEIKN